jgi:PKD repeat protein
LTGTISSPANTVEAGESASFKCTAGGGVSPYTYSWAFGDGAAGVGAILSHTYSTPGAVTLSCTVTDTLGTTATVSTDLTVGSDPSITTFTVSPASLFPGDKLTFDVSVTGGYGPLSYSYANLPPGCPSVNATSLSCYPTSSGNYHVMVTVTDGAMESANATAVINVGPQRILGLPQAIGLAVILGAIAGGSGVVILSVAMALRRKRGRQAPATT